MALFGLFGNSENLYFPGCFSSALLEKKVENYKRILKKLGISFTTEKDFMCCGGFFDESGYEKQLRKTAKQNQDFISGKKFRKIITNCPLCYSTFKNYKEIIPDWSTEVEFILITILKKLQENQSYVRSFSSEPIAYYDSCSLGRYSEIHSPPREILSLLGLKVMELPKNSEETLCCGSCGNLPKTNKELSDSIARSFIRMLLRKNIKKVVTADARAYSHLAENLIKMQVDEKTLELLEFSDVLCSAMNLKQE